MLAVLEQCRSLSSRVVARVALAALLGLGGSVDASLASEDDAGRFGIAVIYPEIGEPYRSAFATIVQGIEERARGRTTSLAIPQDASPAAVADDLKHRNIRTVIALGRSGLKAASGLDRQVNVIAGGVLSVPEADAQGMLVQSLAPDPNLLFAKLKVFVPTARRVVVVYDPRQNEWLIRLARESAKAQGLDLLPLEAEDLKAALRRYQDVMSGLNPRRDVLWLPQDSTTVDESAVLPWVLREAWNQGLVVFSSNVAHVRRGALFSLYPDNAELGRYLGTAAMASLTPGGAPPGRGLQALRQVFTAVNSRTAEHLGVDLRTTPQHINLVLPEQ